MPPMMDGLRRSVRLWMAVRLRRGKWELMNSYVLYLAMWTSSHAVQAGTEISIIRLDAYFPIHAGLGRCA